jgi:RNA polymerase sigma factor (sigma-70 family)
VLEKGEIYIITEITIRKMMRKIADTIGSSSEKEIIKKVVSGESVLFEILVRRYNGVLYKIARMYGFNSQDSEDIVQEAHITAFTELKNFEQRSSYKTWISKITINKCLYKIKHGKSKKEISSSQLLEPVQSTKAEADKKLNSEEFLKILEICVQRLPLSYRTVFVLREVEGYSVNDTSALLDITAANVKVRLNRAKVLLRKEIEKFYSPHELFDIKLAKCDDIVKSVFMKILG